MNKTLVKQFLTMGTFVVCALSLVACGPEKKHQPTGRKRGTANRSVAQVEIVQAPEIAQGE